MDFFSDPNPRTFASSTGIYDRKGDGAKYELDYIPFAKSSSTIVKHAGFNNTATAAFNFLPTQQSSDNRWGPEFPDDARVPRLGGSYHEDSPTADMAGHTFLSQTQGNNMESSLGPGLDLSTTNSRTGSSTLKSDGSGVISSAPFRYPGLNPGSDFSMPKPVPMSMSLPLLHQSPSQMMQQQGLSAATGGGDSSVYGGVSEIVTEMPPPLANLRTRKGNRCSRLNDKYARMKRDMELIAQSPYSYHRVERNQYDQSIISASWNAAASQRPFGHMLASVQSAPIPTYSPQSAPVQHIIGQPQLVGGSTRGTSAEVRQLETNSRSPPEQPPSKRVKIEADPLSNRASMSGVTRGGSTAVGSGAGGGGAFSTPHFRMLTPARATEISSPSSHVPLRPNINQGARRAKEVVAVGEEEDDGFDDWGLEDILLDSEPLLVPSPNTTSAAQGYGNDRFAATVASSTTQTNNNNINNNSSCASLFGYPPRLQQFEKEPFMTNGLSQNTPDQIVGQDMSNQDRNLSSAASAAVLDERTMPLLERIHRMGSEMQASAAATVPRFMAVRGQTTREERAGQVQDQYQDQRHSKQQQQQRARQLSKAKFSFTSFRAKSFATVIGRRNEAGSGGDPTPDAKSLANELVPVPRDTLAVDTQSPTSPPSLQEHALESKRDDCLGEATETLAPDMGFLGEVEKEIQGFADF